QEIELGRRELAVLLPPDRLFGVLVADDELVLGAAAGVDSGLRAQRSALDDLGLAVGQGVLVKGRFRQVPVSCSKAGKAKFVGAVRAVSQTYFLHGASPQTVRRCRKLTPHGRYRFG